MFYDFNPRHRANHVERRYLGAPGGCNVMLGHEREDPKYRGKCGQQYRSYSECLVRSEFDRKECRPREQEVESCEQQHLSDISKQVDILANWRKNKGAPVRSSYVPFKLFDEEPKPLAKE